MNAIFGQIVAGLGLFFLGLHLIGSHLKQVSSRRFRALMARFTKRVWMSALLGIAAGGIMQSTSAVTMILASMTASGLVTVSQALPIVAWTNVGTTLLVFAAVIDLKIAVLYAVGLSGTAFSFASQQRWRTLVGVVLGIALLFYGIDVMKSSATQLQTYPWFQAVMNATRTSYMLALFGGALLSFITQSTTAVTLIALTMVNAGVLSVEQCTMIIYGGNVGSTFSRMILASGLRGSSRQIARFQDGFKILGTVLFVILFYVEILAQVPLVLALVSRINSEAHVQMALVNLVYNVVMALLLTPFVGPLGRLLDRLWPATAAEDFAKVRYLHPLAIDDPDTTLDLTEMEQSRLIGQLPAYLSVLRPAAGPKRYDYRAIHVSFDSLAREVGSYLQALVPLQLSSKTSERLSNIQSRHELILDVEQSVFELVQVIERAPPSRALSSLIHSVVESLDFLLLSTGDALHSQDPLDQELLLGLCSDRGPTMGKIRKLYLSSDDTLPAADKQLLLGMTTVFERTVWMLHRLGQLIGRRDHKASSRGTKHSKQGTADGAKSSGSHVPERPEPSRD